MKYWICCDAGGTKTIMVLINQNLEIIKTVRAGGVNLNFTPAEKVREHLVTCFDAIFDGFSGTVEGVYGAMLVPSTIFSELLGQYQSGVPVHVVSEGLMGVMAGLCRTQGVAALAGTGSDVFVEDGHTATAVGGWGLTIGDEGSGSWIGQQGYIAAIHGLELRGPATLLSDYLLELVGVSPSSSNPYVVHREMRGPVANYIYRAPSQRKALADFAPIVSTAASQGDLVAIGILERAGFEMSKQFAALVSLLNANSYDALALPLTICGGAWRGHNTFFYSFSRHIYEQYPTVDFHWPLFDAIAGGAVKVGLILGYSPAEVETRLLTTFEAYRYPSFQ